MNPNQPNLFSRAFSKIKSLFGAKPDSRKAEPPPIVPAPAPSLPADWLPRWCQIADHFVRDPSQRNRLARVYGLPTPPTKNDQRTMRSWVLRCYHAQKRLPI